MLQVHDRLRVSSIIIGAILHRSLLRSKGLRIVYMLYFDIIIVFIII
jgi:hypothetical protein